MSVASGSAAILDLKAELLRKYNNAEKKNRSSEKVEAFTVRKGGFRVVERKPKETKTEHHPPPDDGEEEALEKSRRCLEEKARLYDLKKSEVWTEEDEDTLIDFNRKRKLARDQADEESDDSDSEWVTFTDALGRTRKCLRTDLTHYMEENARLTDSLGLDNKNKSDESKREDSLSDIFLPGEQPAAGVPPEQDSNKEERLKRWNEIEQQNYAKEHLHYRDVLFDEIREHGQAHFEFSRDETEREHQMKILDKLRDDSAKAQKLSQVVKSNRERIHRERMNKIRARRGLPPAPEVLPPEPTPPPPPPAPTPSTSTTSVPQVRPWDEGKEVHGVPLPKAAPKRDYYAERRDERLPEFAPPELYPRFRSKNQNPRRSETPDVSEFLKNIRDCS